MTAKEYLKQVGRWRRKIESIQALSDARIERQAEELERLYHLASGMKAITYDRDIVQVSPENRLEAICVQIEEASKEITQAVLKEKQEAGKKIRAYEEKIEKIADEVAGMEKEDHAEILRLRYLETEKDGRQMRLEKIACVMNRTFDRVRHLHGEALEEFRKRYLQS